MKKHVWAVFFLALSQLSFTSQPLDFRSKQSQNICPDNVTKDPLIFNWGDYISRYPDLIAAGIDSQAEAEQHWTISGLGEGRQASPLFNAQDYLQSYGDLQAAFENQPKANQICAAANHFISNGYQEGRVAAPFDRSIFDWKFYVTHNPDLSSFDEASAKAHWTTYGIQEGRQGNYGFHAPTYLNLNGDLRAVTGEGSDQHHQAILHWQQFGQFEGRLATNDRVPMKKVGIFYLTWHTLAASAQQYAAEMENAPAPTVSDILSRRRDGRPDRNTIGYMLSDRGLIDHAAWFHYHNQPELGYYSLYQPRTGEARSIFGDREVRTPISPRKVARQHADWLVDAGVDFIYVDGTNFTDAIPQQSELMGIRPLEVLLDEWVQYRQEGGRTPQVAVWSRISDKSSGILEDFLAFYQDSKYDEILLKDAVTGKKVFFYVNTVNPKDDEKINFEKINQLRQDLNLMVIPMWGGSTESQEKLLNDQAWSWMSLCTDGNGVSILDTSNCTQPFSPRMEDQPSSVSVSVSYQTGYASHGMATGFDNGNTLKNQFIRAFNLRPDYLLINAWNEHIAQPEEIQEQAAPGLEGDRRPDGYSGWVDIFGAEYARDIEPTQEWEYTRYNLLKSCLSAYRTHNRSTCD